MITDFHQFSQVTLVVEAICPCLYLASVVRGVFPLVNTLDELAAFSARFRVQSLLRVKDETAG